MNAKLLGFAVCVEVINYVLLDNCTFNFKRQTLYKFKTSKLETELFHHLLVPV